MSCGLADEAASQIGEHLDGHACAYATGIDELAVIGVVAEQQRPEMRPRAIAVLLGLVVFHAVGLKTVTAAPKRTWRDRSLSSNAETIVI